MIADSSLDRIEGDVPEDGQQVLGVFDRNREVAIRERVSVAPVTRVVRPRVALVDLLHGSRQGVFASLEQHVIVRRQCTEGDTDAVLLRNGLLELSPKAEEVVLIAK